jgi:hypothetical protein
MVGFGFVGCSAHERENGKGGSVKDTIRVGNAQAFWGDRPSAATEILSQEPGLDYLTMDYLAEVSMSILALQRQRDPKLGYAQDFVEVVRGMAEYWSAGGRCRLIANAGGLNPLECARACIAALDQAGCRSMKIGVVGGDDVLPVLMASQPSSNTFQNLDSADLLSNVRDRLVTANAYLGCEGIVQALATGADIVITGRVADPSMVVAPCVYEFGWESDDWNRLAGATVAGHLLECGTHATGGISTDWLDVPDPAHLGFPIAEINSDGSCTITKSEHSGGCVTPQTIKEQLIYEIGDPAKYLSPDCTVSFLALEVKSTGINRVKVCGAIGSPRPATLKVSATYRDGYRAAGMLTFFGPQSVKKARRCGDMVLQRLREAGVVYRDSIVECLGNAESVPVANLTEVGDALYETVLRIAVESDKKSDIERFSRELMPLITAGPQGTTGYAEGRPCVHGVIRYWPCLITTVLARPTLEMLASAETTFTRVNEAVWPDTNCRFPQDPKAAMPARKPISVQDAACLLDVAHGRSGDKGTGANIGILVRSMQDYDWMKQWLTAERVKQFFEPIGVTSVERFEMQNIGGFNFVVKGILRRGLRNDAQGKALAQALLSMRVDQPECVSSGFP